MAEADNKENTWGLFKQYWLSSKKKKSDNPRTISSRQAWGAGFYTLAFFSLPIAVYSHQPSFKSFCRFHSRILGLEKRGPGGLMFWAIIMSGVYSSICIPIYYKGVLWILGMKSLKDLQGHLTQSIIDRFNLDMSDNENETPHEKQARIKNKAALKSFDEKFVYGLDETCGVPREQTDAYFSVNGREIMHKNIKDE